MKPYRGGKMANGSRKSRLMPVVTFWPITKRCLDERQRRDCGRVRAQDPRPEAQAQHARRRQDRGALIVVEAAFRPDQEADAAFLGRVGERIERARLVRFLVAEDEQALSRPALERLTERLDGRNL